VIWTLRQNQLFLGTEIPLHEALQLLAAGQRKAAEALSLQRDIDPQEAKMGLCVPDDERAASRIPSPRLPSAR
jgi:hypothetical protein